MPLLRIEKQMADSDCEKADYYPRAGHMKYTRRDFFEAAGAIVALSRPVEIQYDPAPVVPVPQQLEDRREVDAASA